MTWLFRLRENYTKKILSFEIEDTTWLGVVLGFVREIPSRFPRRVNVIERRFGQSV